jgi:hypothetical protein
MKNIQFIDGALNSAYDIFACEDSDFKALFPGDRQDIEFIEDVVERMGDDAAGAIIIRVSQNKLNKPNVDGIHGTMFFGLAYKREYYPRKIESDLDALSRGAYTGQD